MSHIDHHFDEALEELKQQIRLMGQKVESMLADAVRSFLERDVALARQLIERDHAINALEVSIDEMCIELLVRYQPAASDLRFITRGLKIVTDLERVGDLTVNMGNRVMEMAAEDSGRVDLTRMVEVVQSMFHEGIAAFAGMDATRAVAVLKQDDIVDDLTETHVKELLDRLTTEPGQARGLFPVTSFVRHLERIADHATNIAEQAIFTARGLDVRHGRPR